MVIVFLVLVGFLLKLFKDQCQGIGLWRPVLKVLKPRGVSPEAFVFADLNPLYNPFKSL